jgi:hypothetical protein
LAQFLVELHEHSVFVLDFELLGLYLVTEEEVLSSVLQFAFEAVILRYFADGLEVSFEFFALFPHFRESVAHFVEHITETDDSHDFDEHSDDDFLGTLRSYVSVPNRQHRR